MVLERDPFDAFLFWKYGSSTHLATLELRMIALGSCALRDGIEILEQALADHRDAEVAGAEILLGAVGDAALPDPGDDVLVDDVARDPAAVARP